MSKNFANEYKEYIRTETPDLWDRIEKSLTERETLRTTGQEAGREAAEEKPTENAAENLADRAGKRAAESQNRRKKKEDRKGKKPAKLYFRIGGGLAAAVLVLAVAAPVLKNQLFWSGQSKSNSGNSLTMSAADEAMEEAAWTDGNEAGSTGMAEMWDAAEETAGSENAQEALDGAENSISKQEKDVVKLELTIISIKGEEDGGTVYHAESETGESYSFVLAEEALVEEKIRQEGGLLPGNRYSVELEEGEKGYRAVAVESK